jgi:hypothetical protein
MLVGIDHPGGEIRRRQNRRVSDCSGNSDENSKVVITTFARDYLRKYC